MRILMAGAAVSLVALVGGCAPKQGLLDVMREYGYTAMVPPSSAWELGTPVEVGGANANHPFTLVLPSAAGAPPASYSLVRDAPKLSQGRDDKYGLDVGVSLPDVLKGQLQLNGARKYSVVATGNRLYDLNYSQYVAAFPAIRAALGDDKWDVLVKDKRAAYLSSLWMADTLEYEFYNEAGGKITVDASKLNVPVDFNTEWKLTNNGTLSYSKTDGAGAPIPCCLGFVIRPIVRGGSDIGPGSFPGGPPPGVRAAGANEISPLSTGFTPPRSETAGPAGGGAPATAPSSGEGRPATVP